MLTDNPVILRRVKDTPTIFCAQRSTEKKEVSEDDLVRSNVAGFGDDIGKTTNYITSMYDVRDAYPEGSEEFNILTYRIRCGQLFQQNCIDRIKGVECKPMPRYWFDSHAARTYEDDTSDSDAHREMNMRIVADRKPYFMRYIYPAVDKDYKEYIKKTRTKCSMLFGVPLERLLSAASEELSEEQSEFIWYYKLFMPVGMNGCVMNRICRRFEAEFGDKKLLVYGGAQEFDYSVLKSGVTYKEHEYFAVARIYKEYVSYCEAMAVDRSYSHRTDPDSSKDRAAREEEFMRRCYEVCSDGNVLCDILVDICYRRESGKSFVWSVCGEVIIENLLSKRGDTYSYPAPDPDGDIFFSGNRFSMKTVRREDYERDRIE